ncbi:MAG: TonB-dependent receptor [Candidatus Latescibacterota bacterium]|nr:MAG: TonB-dependent receptor [Candidatus Latescibacterota bacterium]
MRGFRAIVAAVVLASILIPALCLASDVGKIVGKVTEKATGKPLVYANIVLLGTPRGAMSLTDGTYAILNVSPGTYEVQASYMGYKTMIVQKVVIEPDLTRTVDFELEETVVGTLEPIIVEAEKPLVQVDVTSTRKMLLSSEIQSLPVDNPVQVINYIAGSSVAATGTHIRGGRAQEVGYYIDDAPVQDPIANNALINVTNQSVNEMIIFTGGFNAEYGNASSGIVNIITNEGSDTFEGSAEYRMYLPVQMFWTKFDGPDPLDTGEMRSRLYFSGPIYKKEQMDLRYSLAMEASDWDDWQPRVEALDRPGKQRLYDGVLTFRRGNTKIKGVFNIDNDRHVSSYDPYRLYERYYVQDTWRHTNSDTYRGAVNVSHMFSERSFAAANFSVLDGELELAQPGKKWDPALSYQENQDLYDWNLDIRRDANNFIISGDNPYYDWMKRRVYSFRGSFTHQRARNEVKTGLDLNIYDVQEIDVFASTQNYYIYEYDVQPRAGALYAQDKLEFEGLIMNVGLRLDFFDPNHKVPRDFDHPYDPNAPDSLWHGPDNDNAPIELERYDDEGNYLGGGLVDAEVKWKLSPRLGVSYPITDDSYLHMQYGHFFQMPSFDYLYENAEFHTRGRWMIAGNADLEAEKTVAYEIGVNHLLSPNIAIDFTFFYKDITDMTEQVVVGPTAVSNPQGRANYVTFDNVGYGNVRGFEINLVRRHINNWHYRGAYTFMVAKGLSSNVNEGGQRRFDNEEYPTQQFYLDWDRRHSFLVTGGYGIPKNWSIDFAVNYATGAPYTNPVTLTRKPTRNNARFPSINNVDVEVHKMFEIFDIDADIFLRATNLFNQRNIISWDDTDQDFKNWYVANDGSYLGPFGDYTIYGAPRNFVGGVKISF